MIELGMHANAVRPLSGSFQMAAEAAVKHGLAHIEFSVLDGQYFIQALGYEPCVPLQSNPRALRQYLEQMGLHPCQIDASFPIMGPEGSTFGVRYIQQAIRFAAEIGCPIVATTDGAMKLEGYTDQEVFRIACENYRQCLSWAEDYHVIINVETHGPYTTDGDFLERLFTHFESEYLRLNFDTGNTFISGRDPLEYLKRFRKYLAAVHAKDISQELAAAVRGQQCAVVSSQAPSVGGGVNAENIKQCIDYLRQTDWSGVVSIECHGCDENIRKSVEFLGPLLV